MVDRNTITKMAKRILRSPKGVRGPQVIHPERDWLLGLMVAIGVFVFSVIFAVYEYNFYRNITVTDHNPIDEIEIYRENMVKDALDKFTERAQEHQSLLDNVSISRASEVAEATAEPEVETVTDETLDAENSDETEDILLDEAEVILEESGDQDSTE